MFTQFYTVNKMQEHQPQPLRHSHDAEKDQVAHLEKVTTRTPPSELEKSHDQKLTPIVSRAPEVHEKVRYHHRILPKLEVTYRNC